MLKTEPLPHRQPETRTTRQGAPLRASSQQQMGITKTFVFLFFPSRLYTQTHIQAEAGGGTFSRHCIYFLFPLSVTLSRIRLAFFARKNGRKMGGKMMGTWVGSTPFCKGCSLHFAILF